ncbi:MAG: AbrB family transcriptional regulator [Zestosphaera tikiterensis]|uniref:AbrB family transcriptional regulator n=1 Tax=Zestosphaera tikiterensis TaxID=1973259 RepID=A0A2R7Y6L4_9CREN|nr:MAG: AbrB family transcriptional regulator [Zestosphaera tikiterensis]
MKTVLKVGRKGIVVLPKAFREKVCIEEGGKVVLEIVGNSLVLKPLKPLVVDIDPEVLRKVILEEKREWEERIDRVAREVSS